MRTVLYFGIFDPEYSRTKVYIEGLRKHGIQVLVCTDRTPGLRKYWRLYRKHKSLRNAYDVLVVGYPGHIVVPFARMVSRKKVVFDALCSYYETEVLSKRNARFGKLWFQMYTKLIDKLAIRTADVVLVETNAQHAYFTQTVGASPNKVKVAYTGVHEDIFYRDASVKKRATFTAIFRGRITTEAGAEHVVAAAKLLEKDDIDVIVLGYGRNEALARFTEAVVRLAPANLLHIDKHVDEDELRTSVAECHVALGQFADHERLSRTIPHKAFEAMVMKLPYVTARAQGIEEVLTDGTNCIMVEPASPQEIADAVRKLKAEPEFCKALSENAFQLFQERFTTSRIVQPLVDVVGSDGS